MFQREAIVSDPTDPYKRINELKRLIDTIHQNGIRVILDVVYNHVYERETSSFEKIVPGYFFRHDESWNAFEWNWGRE